MSDKTLPAKRIENVKLLTCPFCGSGNYSNSPNSCRCGAYAEKRNGKWMFTQYESEGYDRP